MSFFRYGADDDDLDDAEEKLSRFCRFGGFADEEEEEVVVEPPKPAEKPTVVEKVSINTPAINSDISDNVVAVSTTPAFKTDIHTQSPMNYGQMNQAVASNAPNTSTISQPVKYTAEIASSSVYHAQNDKFDSDLKSHAPDSYLAGSLQSDNESHEISLSRDTHAPVKTASSFVGFVASSISSVIKGKLRPETKIEKNPDSKLPEIVYNSTKTPGHDFVNDVVNEVTMAPVLKETETKELQLENNHDTEKKDKTALLANNGFVRDLIPPVTSLHIQEPTQEPKVHPADQNTGQERTQSDFPLSPVTKQDAIVTQIESSQIDRADDATKNLPFIPVQIPQPQVRRSVKDMQGDSDTTVLEGVPSLTFNARINNQDAANQGADRIVHDSRIDSAAEESRNMKLAPPAATGSSGLDRSKTISFNSKNPDSTNEFSAKELPPELRKTQSGSADLMIREETPNHPRANGGHRPSVVARRLGLIEKSTPVHRNSYTSGETVRNSNELHEHEKVYDSDFYQTRMLWGGNGSSILLSRLSSHENDMNFIPPHFDSNSSMITGRATAPPESLVENAMENENPEDVQNFCYSDEVKTEDLLWELGLNNGWYPDEINHDIEVLQKNRIRKVKDLRKISKEGWEEVKGLMPIVKDMIRQAVMI